MIPALNVQYTWGDSNSVCTVYLMDGGRSRRRELKRGLIPQLFQGRSSAGADRYPGDRAFVDKGCVTIQLHNLSIVEEDGTRHNDVFTVAVRLPVSYDVIVQPEES